MAALIGGIGSVVGLVGWYGLHFLPLLIIGFAGYVIATVMEWKTLSFDDKKLRILLLVLGCLVSRWTGSPFYVSGMTIVCIYGAAMASAALINYLRFRKK